MNWAPLDEVEETRFGSTTADVGAAAALLRAQARSWGMVLVDAPRIDLAAAVIGADAWMALASAGHLRNAPRYGARAADAFFAVLMRATGLAPPQPASPEDMSVREEWIALADGYRRWGLRHVGSGTALALRMAASDLTTAGPGTPFSEFGGILAATADAMALGGGDPVEELSPWSEVTREDEAAFTGALAENWPGE